MSRIPAISPTEASGKTGELLAGVARALGATPNLFRVAAQSPAALEGLIALNGALQRTALSAKARHAVALAIASYDDCGYCLAAHHALGRAVGLSDGELASARDGGSADPTTAAALHLARAIAASRGHVDDGELARARARLGDREIVEVVALVALNVFTNYLNSVARTDLDFPAAP
ncbi:MAG TPA: carboxymuconolactone decarboxylase family protein [Kofleriaceae bacterium]|nr:carboxymuconolactone decarboxylase family protein [Kofleriaceae bacterium]